MFHRKSKSMLDRVVSQVGVMPLVELLPALLGEIAALLEVERTSYFKMTDDGSAIQLEIQCFLSTRATGSTGLRLRAADYPGYFAALREPTNLVVSHDVMHDPRLVEFQQDYFKALGISSMLDVPVHRSGKLFGVICLEHVGAQRQWTGEDMDLARSLGQLVALAIETHDRQLVEEELRVALGREKDLLELKTNFVNLVSHEFRTPLGIIYSAADILESYAERLTPAQRADHLHDIRHSARQMSDLMEEVLLLGKVESGQMSCRMERFELTDFCRRIVDEQCAVTHHRQRISVDLADLAGEACGDEGLLRHILGNLLSNALKYSPDEAEVCFSARRDGTCAEFEIKDCGIGIDPADHKHLFTAFFRGRNAGGHAGTGLGLVIVKRCVDLHGGSLRFESRLGEGTRFIIRLEIFTTAL